jgi:hypothetical protein
MRELFPHVHEYKSERGLRAFTVDVELKVELELKAGLSV